MRTALVPSCRHLSHVTFSKKHNSISTSLSRSGVFCVSSRAPVLLPLQANLGDLQRVIDACCTEHHTHRNGSRISSRTECTSRKASALDDASIGTARWRSWNALMSLRQSAACRDTNSARRRRGSLPTSPPRCWTSWCYASHAAPILRQIAAHPCTCAQSAPAVIHHTEV